VCRDQGSSQMDETPNSSSNTGTSKKAKLLYNTGGAQNNSQNNRMVKGASPDQA